MKGILVLEVGGVFRTVNTVVRIEEFYARRVHKTILETNVVLLTSRRRRTRHRRNDSLEKH